LPYISGYTSPALHWVLTRGMDKIRALAARHPGFDVARNSKTRYWIGDHARGARWVTFLGPALGERLGGPPAMAKDLGTSIDVTTVGEGTMIRAGAEPELGDVNKNIGLPLLRKVAKLIEPVTMFNERALVMCEFFDGYDDPFLEKWERRFLD
jgi:hypothetical protein